MNTSVETFAQTAATAALGVPLSAFAETGLTGTKPKDLGLPWTANLAKAFDCSRDAQREERNGFPYTAAMKWRNAAALFAPDTRAVEYCWREWERIMQLPRRLAGPVYADRPSNLTGARHPQRKKESRVRIKAGESIC